MAANLALFVSALSLLVSALTFWFQYADHLNLTINPSIETQFSSENKLVTTIAASNSGNRTIVLTRQGLLLMEGKISMPPSCQDESLLRQIVMDIKGKAGSYPQLNYFESSDVDGEVEKTSLNALAVVSNGVISRRASFKLSNIEWSGGQQTFTLCPIYFFLTSSGQSTAAMCRGWRVHMSPLNNQKTFQFLDVAPSATLLPDKKEVCVEVHEDDQNDQDFDK